MPHSSGGGSHGGGYHSSSSHSYSRSSSSSGSSYSSGPSEKSFSRHPYPGASRYVYYDRRGRYHNIYHEGFTERADSLSCVVGCAIVGLIVIPLILVMLFIGVEIPRKVDLSKYESVVFVHDEHDLIDNDNEVYKALVKFQETTGVTACVEVVNEEDSEGYYSLENYALSKYLMEFNDEYHWLIVLRIPESNPESGFVDWDWEGMIGDDVGRAVNSDAEDNMTVLMQSNLLRCENDTRKMGKAIADTFNSLCETVMTPVIHYVLIAVAVIIAAFGGLFIWVILSDYFIHKKMERAVMVSANAKEAECKYCGCAYIVGSISVCPHCGAAIPAHNE